MGNNELSSKNRPKTTSPEGASRRVARKPIHIHEDVAYYVIRTEPRCERRVTNGLRERGLPYYYPTLVHDVVKKGKRDRRESAALPSYIFVGLDKASPAFGAIHDTDGVASLLTVEGKPFPVPASALKALEFECCKGARPPEQGDQMKVVAGPFVGFVAEIKAVMSSDRVKVLIAMFGNIPVEMPVENLQAA